MLHVPGGSLAFGVKQQSQTGRPVLSQGTSVTPAAGSKGSWVQVIASLTEDTYGLLIHINNNNTSAASRNTVLDVGVGAAASEIVVIPDLICGNALNGNGAWYFFPIRIKAGTRIAVRANSTVATAFNVYIEAMQKPTYPEVVKTAGFVEAVGITGNDGVAVTPGTTSEGAWVSLGTTVRECWFWQIGAQVTDADTTHNAGLLHLDLAVGDATNKQIIIESAPFITNTTEGCTLLLQTMAAERQVPAGSTLYVRAQHSGTIDTINMAAYGAGG